VIDLCPESPPETPLKPPADWQGICPLRLVRAPLALIVAVSLLVSTAQAQERELKPDEKGLDHPFRISLGGYTASRANSNSDSGNPNGTQFTARADLSFFRATRHEAMVSFQYFNSYDYYAAMLEYRFRFAGEGRAYVGFNAGIGFLSVSGIDVSVVGGSVIGYEFPGRIFTEFRYQRERDSSRHFNSFLIGARF